MPLSSPPLAPLVWLILPRGDIIPGLAPLRLLHRISGQPGGPYRPRGAQTSGPRGVVHLKTPGATLNSLSGRCWRPRTLSSASIIRRPYFHYSLIPGNADYSVTDLHGEVYYDLPTFAEDLELRDSMLLVQRYNLGPFMMPRRFFYPRVVIEFYHTMTSRCEANPTALHFSIDGRPGILRAFDMTAALHLSVVPLPTQQTIDSGPIPRPGRWSVFSPRTLPLGLYYSGGTSRSACY